MNEITTSLARLLGPTLGLIGLGMLLNAKFYYKAFEGFFKESFTLVVTVMAMIPIGVAMVRAHFLWGSLPEVLVSIVALGFLVKGVLLAVMPNAFDKLVKSILSPGLLKFAGVIWLVGGGYLTWVGFGG